jgi:hypothetical protein
MTMFTINETEFGWEEIVAAAESWGEWRSFFKQTRQTLACLRWAEEVGCPLNDGEVKAAATAFRYAHNLISAEEAQRWLSRWEMTIADWLNCLRGQLLREHWATRLAVITAAQQVSDAEVAAVIKHYAVCSDKLDQWAQQLAGRAAIAAKAEALPLAPQSPQQLIAGIEAAFAAQRQLTITQAALTSKIADHRLDWLRFDCRYVWFGEERLAREAALCVTEDGLTLDEVARHARAIVQEWSFYLDEVALEARPHFMAAAQGAWLGPLPLLSGYPILQILSKRAPVPNDPQIKARAEQAIINHALAQEINGRVKWLTQF